MGKQKCGEKKGTAKDPIQHTASSVKHGGGGVMAWACMLSLEQALSTLLMT